MCQKKEKQGKIFFRVGSIGAVRASSGSYGCTHSNTIENLFLKYVNVFLNEFFPDDNTKAGARATFAALLLRTVTNPEEALELASKRLELYSNKELFQGEKSVFVLEIV